MSATRTEVASMSRSVGLTLVSGGTGVSHLSLSTDEIDTNMIRY
jgi:hypothetical protein